MRAVQRFAGTVGVAAVVLWSAAVPAVAASAEEIAAVLLDDGVFIDRGADVDAQAVRRAVRDVNQRHGVDLGFVALARAPVDEEPAVARRIARRLGGMTVLVLTPEGFGYYSTAYGTGAQERAADAAFGALRDGDASRGIRQFGLALSQGNSSPFDDDDRVVLNEDPEITPAPAMGRGIPILPIIVLGMLATVGVAMVRGSRTTRHVAEQRLAEARAEVQRQVDALAERILALSDRVALGTPEAQQAYAQATAEFQAASAGLAGATTEGELTNLNDELDRARWQLEVTSALLDGKAPPEKPAEVAACFFDPDHGAGVKQATLSTPAGNRQVGVCDYCAAKLERGEAPEPRRVLIDGESVPVGMAPRQYGGRGMFDLDVFSIIFGGGGPVPYRWGSPYRRRSSWSGGSMWGGSGRGGGFGGGIGGGGSVGSGRRGGGGRSFGSGGGRRFGGGGGGGRSFGGGGGGGGGRRGGGGGRKF